jgi:hypothetical protein
LAFPYTDAYFQQIREALEEKFKRSAFPLSQDAGRT